MNIYDIGRCRNKLIFINRGICSICKKETVVSFCLKKSKKDFICKECSNYVLKIVERLGKSMKWY